MNKDFDRDLPLKKEIAENIEALRKSAGYTLVGLSEISGISKSTLSDYKNYKTLISPGNVEKLAEIFGVTKSAIDPSFKSKVDLSTILSVSLGLYGEVHCGQGEVHFGYPITTIETPKEWINGGEYFYLEATGDSMVGAKVHEGDLLLIRKQEIVENGEIAAVIVGDKRMLKRVYKTNDTFTLVSENPLYPPISYNPNSDENIRIIGKLKKSITNY